MAASQCIAQPCSDSLRFKPRSTQSLPTPSLPSAVGISSLPPTVSSYVSPLSALIPRVESCPWPVPYRGVSTYFSNPKSSTAWTTTVKKIPEILGLSPSHPSIFVGYSQLLCTIFRLRTTALQSFSASVKTHPRYLKEVTLSSGLILA